MWNAKCMPSWSILFSRTDIVQQHKVRSICKTCDQNLASDHSSGSELVDGTNCDNKWFKAIRLNNFYEQMVPSKALPPCAWTNDELYCSRAFW